ncbi:60 kDa chaperonin [archaeon HR04]|nr:60 kDa chaperonin [archaeon HR04]
MTNTNVWRPMAQNIEFDALESNVNAVIAVADTVRTTLGPKGLDKLLIDQAMNRHVSNDGVTILLSLKTIHPVARMVVEIAERQEQLVGDGTTTAVVMAAEMVKEGKRLIKELGVHPTKVVEGIESGVYYACELLEKVARKISIDDVELEYVVNTSLASKLDGKRLASIVISAIRAVGNNASYNGSYDFDKSIKIVRRMNMDDKVISGLILERGRLDKDLPLEIRDARILVCKLDLKPVKESWLKENSRYEDILTMEKDRVTKAKEIVDAMLATGANVILIASPEIDDAVENLLISRRVFTAIISTDEIEHVARYTGAKPVRLMDDLKLPDILGYADRVYEDEDNNIIYIENGKNKNIVTIIVSGTTKETSLERWRAARDGVNAAEAALNNGVVVGGGAAELHVIDKMKGLKLKGLEQVGVDVVAAALESIMRQILTNAGFNGLEKVMTAKALPDTFGIDINTGEPIDMMEAGVLDPLLVKTTALKAAGEIAKAVLRIDRNLAAEDLSQQAISESRR